MINLRALTRSEVNDIEDIIRAKRGKSKSILTSIKAKILSRYASYIELENNNRLKSTAFSVEEKEVLKALYSSKTKTAREITNAILALLDPNHSDRCLYCGVGQIEEIDHFLPQEHFPEFSILHKNLIPTCGRCNQIKGDWIAGEGDKDYLHVVYDILPLESFLECKITYDKETTKGEFEVRKKFQKAVLNVSVRRTTPFKARLLFVSMR